MNRRFFLKALCSAAAVIPLSSIPKAMCAERKTHAISDAALKDYLHVMANFDKPQPDDVILSTEDQLMLTETLKRLRRVQRTVGFGNFCIISFDATLNYSKNYSSIGIFTRKELNFLDKIFHFDAKEYGFLGEKPVSNLTLKIPQKELVKVPHSGNYLYRGEPMKKYEAIKKELGKSVYLTSGVRGVMKQFALFLSKAASSGGNLSLASRSLAPPGYSYHAIGDFDVGEKGLGAANFSAQFASTDTCTRLRELGYLQLRYPQNNLLGVRFEPWHIKV